MSDRSLQAQLFQDVLLNQNLCLRPGEYEALSREGDDRSCLKALLEERGRVMDSVSLHQLLRYKADRYIAAQEEHPQETRSDRSHGADLKAFLFKARSQGLKIAVVTSTPWEEVQYALHRQQISPYFDLLLCGDQLLDDPVKPAGYLQAIAALNQKYPEESFTLQDCLAIEATYQDLDAARSIGLSVVGLTRHRVLHFLQRRSDWVVDRLGDLDFERINANLRPAPLGRLP